MGGAAGLLQSALPSTTFVLAHAAFGLPAGVISAVAVGIGCLLSALAHGRPLRTVLGGFVGIVVSAALALRSGSARDFFLPDLWMCLACATVLAASILIGRPLVGVAWSALNRTSRDWRHDPRARFGYQLATATLAAVFAVRFIVQLRLYQHDETGWLALTRIVLNYPLWAVGLAVTVWAIRRADHRAGAATPPRTPRRPRRTRRGGSR